MPEEVKIDGISVSPNTSGYVRDVRKRLLDNPILFPSLEKLESNWQESLSEFEEHFSREDDEKLAPSRNSKRRN